jgi:uncharacterized protein YxjI
MRRGRGGARPRRGGGDSSRIGTRFQMRQKVFAIGDDFWIKNEQGQKMFKVDGKAFRIRDTLKFEDARGNEIYKIQEKKIRVRDSMNIYKGGDVAAKVHNALITPLRDRWTVNITGGEDLKTQGNIVNHEYKIERGRTTVAVVSKKWFRVRDTYGVEIHEGEDALLILAITVVIDMMAHEGR